VLTTLGYGFYLVHIPVLEVIQENGPLWIAGWYIPLYISAIIGTFVCAYLLHLTVEKPALWLRPSSQVSQISLRTQ
jgi:peptidoglycan/LPS O-acetylase OafA/YrhL